MRNNTAIHILLTGIITVLFAGCTANYAIHLVDEESKPVPAIPIKILDENGEEPIDLDESKSNSDGEFIFPLNKVPGDSFLISIAENEYFDKNEWILTPTKSAIKRLELEWRVTMITGYVLDDSTYNGIPDCEITTLPPSIAKNVYTDEKGKFVLKSDTFAEGLPYTIFATKSPDYIQGTTEIKPLINKRQDLEYPIFLQQTPNAQEVKEVGEEETEIPGGLDPPVH